MTEDESLAEQFQSHRRRLRAVAYRILGSLDAADDAVQETWLRLHHNGLRDIQNLGGWLTTVVARVCLDTLRSHRSRPEELAGMRLPEPILCVDDHVDPEREAITADAVGLALHVVMHTLAPAERIALVLHDMFAVPFGDVAAVLGRTADSARQLASRARRRLREAEVVGARRGAGQREVVAAFFTAARDGDFEALVTVLDPDVVLRVDGRATLSDALETVRGATGVARGAMRFSSLAEFARPMLVNGGVGAVVARNGVAISVMGFTVRNGKITAIDLLADPARLARLDRATFAHVE